MLALSGTSSLNFVDALTIMAIGSIGFVLPSPGGIGTYHYIVVLPLTELYNISKQNATSFAFFAHSSQTLLIIILGGISIFLIFLLKKKSKLS